MAWPEQSDINTSISQTYKNPPGPNYPQIPQQTRKDFATQGTQTSPSMPNEPKNNVPQHLPTNQPNPQQPKRPRRSLAKQLSLTARNRRLQQDYNNYHHPPASEDIWICEFCEYESIFGSPPEALVRQYEIKDRQERRRLAEKRRLLEKAKMKGRKGKKGNKNAAKNSNSANQVQQSASKQRYEQPLDPDSTQTRGTQSEDYLENNFDDDPPLAPPILTQTPSRIPQPVSHKQQSVRQALGSSVNVPATGSIRAG